MSTTPYGPATPAIRRFLVRLAALGPVARAAVAHAYATSCAHPRFVAAEMRLADAIERGDRAALRDALAGPLLQLVRGPDGELDAIAEPALAALLVLLVRDLVTPETVETLYAPFATEIPLAEIAPEVS